MTVNEEDKVIGKDIHRYSFSRFKTFHICPRKHYYEYVEQIPKGEERATLPGSLFHQAVAAILTDKDPKPFFEEFSKACMSGFLELEPDLLQDVVQNYLSYYREDFEEERRLMVEETMEEKLDEDNYIVVVADNVYERDGRIYLRDMKTTVKSLKYSFEDVKVHQQLFLYVPYVEEKLGVKLDAIQIDEIKLAKIGEVPLTNSGKPSSDRRKLETVPYEKYYDYLCDLGLEKESMYQDVLEWLKQRGHPLFNRITYQILDPQIIDANIVDMYDTYNVMKNTEIKYRVRGPLCNWCPFKELCELDMLNPSDIDRDVIKNKIISNK